MQWPPEPISISSSIEEGSLAGYQTGSKISTAKNIRRCWLRILLFYNYYLTSRSASYFPPSFSTWSSTWFDGKKQKYRKKATTEDNKLYLPIVQLTRFWIHLPWYSESDLLSSAPAKILLIIPGKKTGEEDQVYGFNSIRLAIKWGPCGAIKNFRGLLNES